MRRQPEHDELVRQSYFDDPLLEAARRFHRSREWVATREFIPSSPGKAVDLGAGRGIASYALANDGWRVTAIEPDPSAVVGAGAIEAMAAEAGLGITIVRSGAESIPLPDASVDMVYCRQALHHAADLPATCKEIHRILKAGGCFLAVREHVLSNEKDLEAFRSSHPMHHLYGGESAYTLARYLDAMKNAGLRVIRVVNPLESDINLSPQSQEEIKKAWAKRLGLKSGRWIPDWILTVRGRWMSLPGRLYSFVAIKG